MRSLLKLALVLCLIGCEWDEGFYTKKGGWDYIRMPLLPPYELTSLDRGVEWRLGYRSEALSRFMTRVDELVISGSVILLHCDSTIPVEGPIDRETWSLLIPSEHIEIRSFNPVEFRDSLVEYENRLGVVDSLCFQRQNSDSLWKRYVETDKLPWFPSMP